MPDSTEGIQTENVDPIELRLGSVEEEIGTLRGKLWAAEQKIERLKNLLEIKQKMLDEMTQANLRYCTMIDQIRERHPIDSDYQSTD